MSVPIPYELDSLRKAINYQKWVAETVEPFLGERILEVGAGIGNMSKWLPLRERLVLTETETQFIPILEQTVHEKLNGDSRARVERLDLTTDWVGKLSVEDFDTVVSFNVLEHIENDIEAFRQFAKILRESNSRRPKRIITFVPAHPWAYGAIDRGFLHHRRYSMKMFQELVNKAAPGAQLKMRYFNVFGLPGWVVLGRLFKRQNLGDGSVKAFEKLCPYIRGIDDFLHERLHLPFGQSLLAVVTL